MRKLEEVLEEIEKITYDVEDLDELELYNDIVCAFSDYEFEGETEVIVSDNQAYIDHEDSPIILYKLENGRITAWLA